MNLVAPNSNPHVDVSDNKYTEPPDEEHTTPDYGLPENTSFTDVDVILNDSEVNEESTADQTTPTLEIPRITIDNPDQNPIPAEQSSDTETEMSSSHRSVHRSSSSSAKGKGNSSPSSSRSKPTRTDDWSEITDPEERRRVQNRIAQRKFRDKAKEAKDREERDAQNRAHAGHSYSVPDPNDLGSDHDLSGLPWGGPHIGHIVSQGRSRGSESHRRGGSSRDDLQRSGDYGSQEPIYERDPYYEQDQRYEQDPTYYDDTDQVYYDYGSGSGSGPSR